MNDEAAQNGAAALVAALERNGVEVAFGIPGVHNLEIYRSLATSPIEHVAVRHEQGAGYAADGYARASGRPAVCLTTSGPGLTNACTAAATAYADSVPVLLCSPGHPIALDHQDLGLLHEMKDGHGHLDSLVTASFRPSSPEEVGEIVDEVFSGWKRARRRPVHIDLPIDVLETASSGARAGGTGGTGGTSGTDDARQRVRSVFDAIAPPAGGTPGSPESPGTPGSPGSPPLDRAAELLSSAHRPLLVLGGGSRGAAKEIRALAERLGALVVTTVNGKGALPEDHPLSLGASIRLPGTRPVIESADVVVVVGSELGDSDLWGVPVHTQGSVVRIDVDPHQLQKNLAATVAICADAADALGHLIARVHPDAGPARQDWSGRADALRLQLRNEALADGAKYEGINRELSLALPAGTIVAGDSAQVSYFGTAHFWPMGRAGQFLYPTGYATLGYGLPAAIGAKLASPSSPVVALVGDGGFLFTAQELLAAVERQLPIPVVIVDNHGYAEIREGMESRGIPPIGVDRPHVDFAALGASLGGSGYAVGSTDELCARTLEALDADGPTVISIDITKCDT